MTRVAMELVALDEADLEVEVRGSGEPVVLVQTALLADELVALADSLQDRCQVILYHRRGYGGSTTTDGHGSLDRDAADCRDLLAALGVGSAHIAGLSYSGAVALQLATLAPRVVRSLILLEPPMLGARSASQFFAAVRRSVELYRLGGAAAAIQDVMSQVGGPDWRAVLDRSIPGAAAQAERDAVAFFESDMPALLDWRFETTVARRITQPVLHVGGTESGQFFAESRKLLSAWLPQTEDVLLPGADHCLAITHPTEIAAAIMEFVRRHPIEAH